MAISPASYKQGQLARTNIANCQFIEDPLTGLSSGLFGYFGDYTTNTANGLIYHTISKTGYQLPSAFVVPTLHAVVILSNEFVEIPQKSPLRNLIMVKVQFQTPLKSANVFGKTYTTGWVDINSIDEYNEATATGTNNPTAIKYWIKAGYTSVKLRKEPKTDSTVLAVLNGGNYIGESYGVQKKDPSTTEYHQYFITPNGNGWVKTTYITQTAPTGTTTTPTTTTPTTTTPIAADDELPQKWHESPSKLALAFGGLALVIVITIALTKWMQKKKKSA